MAGDTAAEFEVAMRFAQGRGISPDQQQAAHWLELAAQQGLAPAQFRLGGFYEKGIGVKKDLAEARTAMGDERFDDIAARGAAMESEEFTAMLVCEIDAIVEQLPDQPTT